VTLVTGQGGRGCQWRLRLADPALRLNFTLISFFVAGQTWTASPGVASRVLGVGRAGSSEAPSPSASRWEIRNTR